MKKPLLFPVLATAMLLPALASGATAPRAKTPNPCTLITPAQYQHVTGVRPAKLQQVKEDSNASLCRISWPDMQYVQEVSLERVRMTKSDLLGSLLGGECECVSKIPGFGIYGRFMDEGPGDPLAKQIATAVRRGYIIRVHGKGTALPKAEMIRLLRLAYNRIPDQHLPPPSDPKAPKHPVTGPQGPGGALPIGVGQG